MYNYGLSGTGTDRRFIAYQEHCSTEHDLLIIAGNVENIRRVNRKILKSRDSNGRASFNAKPYFELNNGELTQHNVPVPRQTWTQDTLPEEYASQIHPAPDTAILPRNCSGLKNRALRLPHRETIKHLARKVSKYQPLPQYNTADNPQWQLLRAILENWIRSSKVPVILFPIPHYLYLIGSCNPSCYQSRFAELAQDTGSELYDPLPRLLATNLYKRQTIWSESSGHLTSEGHAVMAELLEPVIERNM